MPSDRPTEWSRYSHLGIAIAGAMAGLPLLGYWVDRKHGGGVTFTLVGAALGALLVAYEIWKVARALTQQDEADDDDKP